MKEFYEDVWEQLPERLGDYEFARRRGFMEANTTAGEPLLDLGCGDGRFTALLAARGTHVIGTDVAEGALERARVRNPEIDFVLAAPHGPLPFEDCRFAAVWASEVIEHVADTARWLSEVRRVLAPGGRLLLTTPYHGRVKNVAIALTRFESHADPVGQHLRFYTRRSLVTLLHDFGFEDAEIATAGGPPLFRRMLTAVARRA